MSPRRQACGALAAGLLLGVTAVAGSPPPTPGPVARVGGAIDHAVQSVGMEVSQALLVARVRVALLEHLRRDGLGIHIEVGSGDTIVLAGEVVRRSSRELAGEVAGAVRGVRHVDNRITLAPSSSAGEPSVERVVGRVEREVADALLEAKIKARLIDQLGRVAFGIEVEATDGVVSLSGTVPDRARRELAREIARKTRGVVELHDLLRYRE